MLINQNNPAHAGFSHSGDGMSYVFQEFPKWKYHEDGIKSQIVDDAEAEEALGDGWHDKPIQPSETSEREALIQIAIEHGIKIDKRWSNAKIQKAIEQGAQ